MIKCFKRRHLGLLPPPPSSNFETSSSVQLLINSLCPSSSLHKIYFSLDDSSSSASSLSSCTIFNDPFSLDELRIVINNLRIRSTPGLDKIDYQLISLLPPQYLKILIDILNSVLTREHFHRLGCILLSFWSPKAHLINFARSLSFLAVLNSWKD